jgi:DNA polymerase delta subunit 1
MDPLIFQQIDIDHYIGGVIEGMPGAQRGPVPILRMFGVTNEGNSVCAHIHGFLPYFFVPAPLAFHDVHCTIFRQELNKVLMDDLRSNRDNVQEAVLAVDVCQRSSMYGFYFNEKTDFLRITLALPKLVAPARRLINTISVPPFGQILYQMFEANIDFEVRFMVDTGVVGCNWVELPAGKYTLRNWFQNQQNGISPTTASTVSGGGGASGNRPHPQTKCQLEVDISYEDFISHPAEGEWQKIAPLRILSFDIECAGRKGVFPEAERDPVIQIANVVVYQGERDAFVSNVFTLGDCGAIAGSDVREFKDKNKGKEENEAQLLQVSTHVLLN